MLQILGYKLHRREKEVKWSREYETSSNGLLKEVTMVVVGVEWGRWQSFY